MTATEVPEELEEYRIVRLLGRGGMGQVYLAEDRLLARLVAIKIIASRAPSPAARARFFVEARAVARLSHPNVVAVHRVGELRRQPFLVSEYVRGQSLAELAKPVPWRRVLEIGVGLSRGLAAAHRRGVLHRDIKPGNAMIAEDGTVKLLDFGLAELSPEAAPSAAPALEARVSHADAPSTIDLAAPAGGPDETATQPPRWAPGSPSAATASLDPSRGAPGPTLPLPFASMPRAAGTPLYMAPELWRGEPATPRTDVYALGVVLHELCTGAPPYGRLDLASLLLALSEGAPPPLRAVEPGVDPRFAEIVDRCVRRDPEGRFRDGDALREALEQVAAPITPREAAFLEASRRAAQARRRLRWTAAVGVPLVIGLLALGVRVKGAREMSLRVAEVRRALGAARAARDGQEAQRHRAFAGFDAGQEREAEAAWAVAVREGARVETAYAEVCQRLELVLQQDGGQQEARGLLADALYERAELADRDGRAAERDDLVRRLHVYDRAGRWDAPARLSIATSPPGAEVALERYQTEEARWIAAPEAALGRAPIAERPVAPGSIVLTFSAPLRAKVRLPVLLARGETRRITVELPAAAAVPAGFIYVPPGRFLYGCTGGEEIRTAYGCQPQHPLETGAYLVAQSETTYADWIAFLRSLPPAERRLRTPGGEKRQGFTVALAELPDGGYQLTFGPDEHPSTVPEGQPFRYAGRDRRASQDWLRFPVSAVSFEDLVAYTAWLDRSGKVPGARPCDEREWERAARGADGRRFPGGTRLDPDDANIDVTYGRDPLGFGPDEVGSHPASDSPFGAHDLAGNVWEWVSTVGRPDAPVGRGGSFFQGASNARVDNREPDVPTRRDTFVGLRICASLPLPKGPP